MERRRNTFQRARTLNAAFPRTKVVKQKPTWLHASNESGGWQARRVASARHLRLKYCVKIMEKYQTRKLSQPHHNGHKVQRQKLKTLTFERGEFFKIVIARLTFKFCVLPYFPTFINFEK